MNRKNLTAAVLAGLAGAAGIVGSAQAVNINPDGLGQVLLYPYYTTNGGNMTLLSVVNTSEDAKAVKVRFLEGQNSREVLDFNLYMSAYDVWTASIKKNADGVPQLKTADTSCTVPYIYGNGGKQEFLPWALDDGFYNDLSAPPKQKMSMVYDDVAGRGSEGHFEMIEMGTLVDGKEPNDDWVDTEAYPICDSSVLPGYDLNDPETHTAPGHPAACLLPRNWTSDELSEKETYVPYGSASAATHDDGVPEDCDQLVDAWTFAIVDGKDKSGYWLDDNEYDIEDPSGGLFGGAAIVNVQAGTMYSYDATAINGFYVSEGGRGDDYEGDELHQEPGTILPSLDSGNTTMATVFMNDGSTLDADWDEVWGETPMDDDGEYIGARGIDAVSYVLMHDQLMNEYTTEVAVGAGTEWVITFPTKQFYVYQGVLEEQAVLRDEDFEDFDDLPQVPITPFTSEWFWHTTTYELNDDETDYVVKKEGYQEYPCEVVQLSLITDREEAEVTPPDDPDVIIPPIVSPAPPTPPGTTPKVIPFELCYETSVIRFGDEDTVGDETEILGSENFHNIDNVSAPLGYEYGWARLNLSDASYGTKGGDRVGLGGLFGLPVHGFAVQSFENNFLGEGADVLANYGGIFTHKYTRSTESFSD